MAGPTAPDAGAQAPEGAGFTLNASDLRFILRQIQISENNAETGQPLLGAGPFQVPEATLPLGLRTVDGSFNNLLDNRSRFGAADRVFPRMTTPLFRPAEALTADLDGPGPATVGAPTSYESNSGFVEDSQPRVASNLIVDQTSANPAAVAAAGLGATPEGGPNGPLFIPNVAPDTGLSAPYNSWFTLFGQFFDHGLDLTNKGGGTIYTPLKDDDPLISGPDGIRGNADDLPPSRRFMALTRTLNQPGPDGQMGTTDDVKEHSNQTTSFVDQNQTYTSHPSHQVFLREYDATDAASLPPKGTGKLLDGGAAGGLATWARIKAQARNELGIQLRDLDVLNVPKLKTDAYGRFLAGPRGYPQIELNDGSLLEGDPAAEGGNGVFVPLVEAKRTGHAFLDDIAHHAAPKNSRGIVLSPDSLAGTADDRDPATYDDEMLDAHFIAGDGRTNENIGLTAIHTIFHSEHNRLVTEIDGMINALPAADQAAWKDANTANGEYWDYPERLFQAARFVTEMEYQHLAFEEFARKVQPQINVFAGYNEAIDPAIVAEFAHATYRFGHSLLNESVERVDADGTTNNVGLIEGFLNPPEFLDGTRYSTAGKAVGALARGMTQQTGNELDEFVTEALRNNLLGLPLDLATINMLRGRDTGIPPLNRARGQFFAASGDAALAPYDNWIDFQRNIRHAASLENFVAAYGTHDSITAASTNSAKRQAARALITGLDAAGAPGPADSTDFMRSTGTWETRETGLNLVDFWTGGLAEKQAPFGGLLGSTMNVVFETQLENLQDGDRFYYLSRTAGLNLLVQLEGNSFAELVQRNSDATGLPADVFSKPDFRFNLSAQTNPTRIVDDLATSAYDETRLLERTPDGTIRFGGPEHVNWIGTEPQPSATPPVSGIDKVSSSEGDDTLRGEGGDDRLEGGAGNDQFIGGLGNDILTDAFGDDVLKGGQGHDAMSSGQGFDLNQGGVGDDFVVGGSDPTETFGGPGDDLIFAGASADIVFGDDGDDWIQGGGQSDLLQGDNGAPFQDDPNAPGSDVIIGEGGNDDLDAEGGNDIMVAGPGIDRSEGLLGFDWVTYKGDPQPARADLFFTGFLPPSVDALQDRFDVVEGLSGHQGDDVLRGDDRGVAPTDMVGHELTAAGSAEIAGLQDVLGATTHSAGNVILGGAGSDVIEGRGGNDVIDGDKWLNVQLRVPNLAAPGTTRLIDDMSEIRADVLAGRMHGGEIEIVRTIATGAANVDTAVFSGSRADYTVDNRGSSVVVEHIAGLRRDGIDRLVNVERLSFTGDGQVVEVISIPTNGPPSGTLAFDDMTPAENQALTATVALTDPDGITSEIAVETQAETSPAVWTPVGQGRTFTPGAGEVGNRLRLVATFVDGDGVQESFTSTPTAAVTNLNDAPNGAPVLEDKVPQEGVRFAATVGTITDRDGLGPFSYEWQQDEPGGTGPFAAISGPDGPVITPGAAQVDRRLRLVVSYTDGQGTPERVLSTPSAAVRRADVPAGPDPGPGPGPEAPASGPVAGSSVGTPGVTSTLPGIVLKGAPRKSVFYAGRTLVRVSRAGVATILVACATKVAVRCRGTVVLRDSRRRVLGRAPFLVAAGKKVRVSVRLSKVRLKALRTAKRSRAMTLTIKATDRAGWTGTASRKLKIVYGPRR